MEALQHGTGDSGAVKGYLLVINDITEFARLNGSVAIWFHLN